MEQKDDKRICAIRFLTSQFGSGDPEVFEAYILMAGAFGQMRSESEIWLKKFDLNLARFVPLAMLFTAKDKRKKPSELAEDAGVSRATMTGILDGLEKLGFSRRVADADDRRAINVELTPSGDKLMRKVFPIHFSNIAKMMDGISENERRALASISRKIERNLQEFKQEIKTKSK